MPGGKDADPAGEADWSIDDEIKWLAEEFVRDLTEAAVARGLSVSCAVSLERAHGMNEATRIDVAAEPNAVTLWIGGDDWMWLRASVIPQLAAGRVTTADRQVYTDDLVAFCLALLAGEGRVIHRGFRRDALVLNCGGGRLSLPITRGQAR